MRIIAVALFVLAGCAGHGGAREGFWSVGLSKVDITPTENTWLAGYGSRNKPAEGVSSRLYARALAIDGGVLVCADIIGFTPSLHQRITAEAKKRFNLGVEQVMLIASHTHSGPVIAERPSPSIFYRMGEDHAKVVNDYADRLAAQVIEAIDLALKDKSPATLQFGRSEARFGINRRVKHPDGSWRFGKNPDAVTDPDVPVLHVKTPEGKLRAICYTYACHCTSVRSGQDGFYLYHGDYAGTCSAELERQNPGALALYVTGCGADIDPNPTGNIAVAEGHGRTMAEAVSRAGKFRPISGTLRMRSSRVVLPLEKPSKEHLDKLAAGKEGERKSFAQRTLKQMDDGSLATAVSLPIKGWRFGSDLTLVAIGGEVCVDYALRLKRELGAEKTWVAGYSNEVTCYIPSERVLNEGGYEAGWALETGRGVGAHSISGYGWPAPFAPGVENRVVEAVRGLASELGARPVDGNRLAYLDESDPYYPGLRFPKLTTPQWVGEEGVEAVVILGIDDMRGPEKWEAYLRPILERLKKIDGRAPVSIMTCSVDPNHPQLQTWLKEGLSLECHTVDHPCPILKDGDFKKAKSTYDRCVDVMSIVPGNKPVAFRVPCCDSLNTPSPRFYEGIFNGTTENGNSLQIDTSVFNIFTSKDPDLPRELVLDPDGKEKFLKYVPAGRSFVNTIEDYPYPYVLGQRCWEFPCVTPSDWQGFHLQKANNPDTVRDMKAALDITVLKQGVYCLVFHPHGWIKNEQIIELIDHAIAKHGKKVKFLNFREALERLNKNVLDGRDLREVGVRLIDLENDGFLDMVIGNSQARATRRWSPQTRSWIEGSFPSDISSDNGLCCWGDPVGRFGVVHPDNHASFIIRNQCEQCRAVVPRSGVPGAWRFDGEKWVEDKELLTGLGGVFTGRAGADRGVRMRDLDRDGRCELLVSNAEQNAIYAWSGTKWNMLSIALPAGTMIVDRGFRFIDLDGDGDDDIVFSNGKAWSVHVFESMEKGWRTVKAGKRGDPGEIPMIVRGEWTSNGAWFHSRHMWVQNEDTAGMPNHVDRRSFEQLLQPK